MGLSKSSTDSSNCLIFQWTQHLWKIEMTLTRHNWYEISFGMNSRVRTIYTMDWMKSLVKYFHKATNYKRHLKKTGEYNGQNIIMITSKMRTLAWVNKYIKIITHLKNTDKYSQMVIFCIFIKHEDSNWIQSKSNQQWQNNWVLFCFSCIFL